MKHPLLSFLIIVFITSAMGVLVVGGNSSGGKSAWVNGQTMTIEYDSCEYVRHVGHLEASITHKGNCKYCKQRSESLTNKK